MSRFYVPKSNIRGAFAEIHGDEARHVIDVMRLGKGDGVVVFDGEGGEYAATIISADVRNRSVTMDLKECRRTAQGNSVNVTIAQAIPKKKKMDNIVEKATELGAERIIPLITARTVVHPSGAALNKMSERWRKIAVEASKQSGRATVPEVSGITRFMDAMHFCREYDTLLFACLDPGAGPIKEVIAGRVLGNILVFIGPEGDFTPGEADMAREHGCQLISLGCRVLKTDTAGLFLLSVLNYAGS